MPDCEHLHLRIDSIDAPGRTGVRTAHMACKDCGLAFDMPSTRTDAELAAELAAADPEDVPSPDGTEVTP